MEQILFYEGKWYFFSNFSSFAIEWRGQLWPTAEHAYQAQKFLDTETQSRIRDARSAHDAKKIARANKDKVRLDWDLIKLEVMGEILRAKIKQHPYVREKLLESGSAEIVEDSPNDGFWGRGPNHDGHNHLGRLWMKLRAELRSTQAA